MLRPLVLYLLLTATLSPLSVFAEDKTIAPGKKVMISDSSKQTLAMIEADGTIAWRYKIGPLHDLHVLNNGNILFQKNWTHIIEIDPKTNKVAWEYHCKPTEDGAGKVEAHAFQRLSDGNTMIAESGNARIIEVNPKGEIVKQIKLKVDQPRPHKDTRLVRKTKAGTYLVAHEYHGICREYDADGKVIWEYEVPLFDQPRVGGNGVKSFGNSLYSVQRLDNGNTLIGTGNGKSVIEVTPEKKIVWHLTDDDLEGIEFAWITTVQVLKNGNYLINNCHAGPENPQLIEVDRDKKVVWTYTNWEMFGRATTNSIVFE
ncbi:MAG: PQQ-binding-like beta-propeller repeat protein [Phycisphaeraceae bacterium]